MTLILQAGQARAQLLPRRGGLLAELTLAGPDGPRPLLWLPPGFSDEESGWPGGGAPVLFPFAGRVFHEALPFRYAVAGEVRDMPIHGFAYALPWEIVKATSTTAVLELSSSQRTFQLYPFEFRLTARYELTETALSLLLTAECRAARVPGAPRMPVAMGLHPYFRANVAETSLTTSATAKIRVTPQGGAGKPAPFPEGADEAAARLADRNFHSLILGGHAKPEASLTDAHGRPVVRLAWTGAVNYVVLWTPDPAKGFYCLEPWMGLPDAVHNGEGVVWLAPGESVAIGCQVQAP